MLPIKIATIITQLLLFHKSIMPLKYKITPLIEVFLTKFDYFLSIFT